MKGMLSDAGIAAVRLLEVLSVTADFNPILKSAAGGALHVAKLVEKFKSNTKAWAQFAEHIQKNVALIAQSIANQRAESYNAAGLQKGLEDLNQVLICMGTDIQQMRQGGILKRAAKFVKDPGMIDGMQKEFDKAVQVFHLNAEICIGQDVSQILQSIQGNMVTLQAVACSFEKVEAKLDTSLQETMHIANLTKLPYGIGTTWSSHQMCYPGTRKSILGETHQWIADFRALPIKNIFCLTGAPGAGKSAIANSVANLCAGNGWLATAFFFSREDSTRPSMLFSTIICDLAAKFPLFQASVRQAIEGDPSLASAGPSRQFSGLILPFASRLPQETPIVIVIDALDEGCTVEIMAILLGGISSLPRNILLFITTREVEDVKLLLKAEHVYHKSFYHYGGQELGDTILVAQDNLERIAAIKDLGEWPTKDLILAMVTRSQGLMIWIVAVCQYLKQVPEPKEDLQTILERVHPDDQGAEEKMDELYAMILLSFKWKNKAFAKAYKQAMGTILASKVPLSADAIKALHSGNLQLSSITQMLKPLLLPSEEGKPVQILHQSLHDLLTSRAHEKEAWMHFAINEASHSQELAFLCLQILLQELSDETPGTAYLNDAEKEILNVSGDAISEHLQYACRFWMSHILDNEGSSPQIINALQVFLDSKFILWLEVTACIGSIIDINPLFLWVEKSYPHLVDNLSSKEISEAWTSISYKLRCHNRKYEALIAAELGCKSCQPALAQDCKSIDRLTKSLLAVSGAQSDMGMRQSALQTIQRTNQMYRDIAEQNPAVLNAGLTRSLHNLLVILSDKGRREEALQASRDVVDMYKRLVEQNPTPFNTYHAKSLDNLGVMLSSMGLGEEALQTSRDTVHMYKEIAEHNPAAFSSHLARSLHNLGNRLSEMGQREEALQAARDATEMYKGLAEQNPSVFNPDLARCLGSLGTMLSDVGLREEALQATRDVVDMYRNLAEQNPFSFNSALAVSLHNLGNMLSHMGLRKEALQASRNAVDMHKKLAEQNPTDFNSDHAMSLNNLGIMLSEMGIREEALQASREAVDKFKKLAECNPIAFNPALAMSLHNLGNRFSDMGQREKALQASRDAMAMYKNLAEQNPSAFNPELARCLGNLGIMLSDMDLKEEALQATRDTVDMYKELAEQNPVAFSPDLARSLDNLGIMLSEMGMREEALQASRDAVDMYKNLDRQNPIAFKSALAVSLLNLGHVFLDMGLREEALQATRDAVVMHMKLAEQNPAAFNAHHAMSLSNLGVMLSDIGLREEALQASRDAVDKYKQLAKQNPAVFNSDLAKSLHNFSVDLKAMDLSNEALAANREAIQIWEMLIIQQPNVATYKTDLADSIDFQSELKDSSK